MNIKSFGFLLASAFATSVSSGAQADTVVVTFDDLPVTGGQVANGYGGINWNNNWTYWDSTGSCCYPAESSPNVIYTTYGNGHPPGTYEGVSFSFVTPEIFNGAYVTGVSAFGPTYFELFNGANLVATSASISQASTSQFLASGYDGLVTSVEVVGADGYYGLDNVTYTTAAVSVTPIPAALPLFASGLGALGLFGWLRKRQRVRSGQCKDRHVSYCLS